MSCTISENFYIEEVRSDYLVTSQMKKVWAVELDLLSEAKRVFDKYNIRWYAIGGTLLGAVRHKGFIPWDDDIDIAIPRQDYIRLQSVAKEEFKHPYFFQDEYSDPGILYGHAKLRNSDTTCISSVYLDDIHGRCAFNFGIFIDFFPIDNIPDDIAEQELWLNNVVEIARLAWRIRKYTHRRNPYEDKFLDLFVRRLDDEGTPNLFFEIYDDLLSAYSNEKTKEMFLYSLFRRDKRFRFYSEDFKDVIQLQFESLEVPAPAGYDRVLTQLYQDWHVMKQLPTLHSTINGSFFDTENSYSRYVDKEQGINRELIRELIRNRRGEV